MKRLALALGVALAIARCASAPPPPPPAPEPPPAPMPAPSPEPLPSIGTLRVTSSSANIRREASTASDVIVQVKRGEHLALLAKSGEWMNVRLTTGETGWVSSKLVTNDAPKSGRNARSSGCPADSDYRFITAPKPAFSDSEKHGEVTVEANVNASGVVTSTRVVANTTGDEALGFLTEREIKSARFAPPVRNCVPKAFIFTYKRAF